MAKELQTHSSAVVRNNIMLVLGDLAVQFPSLVDNYAPSLARCVRRFPCLTAKRDFSTVHV